jgi:hypothetical protein
MIKPRTLLAAITLSLVLAVFVFPVFVWAEVGSYADRGYSTTSTKPTKTKPRKPTKVKKKNKPKKTQKPSSSSSSRTKKVTSSQYNRIMIQELRDAERAKKAAATKKAAEKARKARAAAQEERERMSRASAREYYAQKNAKANPKDKKAQRAAKEASDERKKVQKKSVAAGKKENSAKESEKREYLRQYGQNAWNQKVAAEKRLENKKAKDATALSNKAKEQAALNASENARLNSRYAKENQAAKKKVEAEERQKKALFDQTQKEIARRRANYNAYEADRLRREKEAYDKKHGRGAWSKQQSLLASEDARFAGRSLAAQKEQEKEDKATYDATHGIGAYDKKKAKEKIEAKKAQEKQELLDRARYEQTYGKGSYDKAKKITEKNIAKGSSYDIFHEKYDGTTVTVSKPVVKTQKKQKPQSVLSKAWSGGLKWAGDGVDFARGTLAAGTYIASDYLGNWFSGTDTKSQKETEKANISRDQEIIKKLAEKKANNKITDEERVMLKKAQIRLAGSRETLDDIENGRKISRVSQKAWEEVGPGADPANFARIAEEGYGDKGHWYTLGIPIGKIAKDHPMAYGLTAIIATDPLNLLGGEAASVAKLNKVGKGVRTVEISARTLSAVEKLKKAEVAIDIAVQYGDEVADALKFLETAEDGTKVAFIVQKNTGSAKALSRVAGMGSATKEVIVIEKGGEKAMEVALKEGVQSAGQAKRAIAAARAAENGKNLNGAQKFYEGFKVGRKSSRNLKSAFSSLSKGEAARDLSKAEEALETAAKSGDALKVRNAKSALRQAKAASLRAEDFSRSVYSPMKYVKKAQRFGNWTGGTFEKIGSRLGSVGRSSAKLERAAKIEAAATKVSDAEKILDKAYDAHMAKVAANGGKIDRRTREYKTLIKAQAELNAVKKQKTLVENYTTMGQIRKAMKGDLKAINKEIGALEDQISPLKRLSMSEDEIAKVEESIAVLEARKSNINTYLIKESSGTSIFSRRVTATAADAEEVVSKPNLWERITAGYRSATEAKVTRVKTNQAIESVSKWQDRLKDAKKAKASVEEIAKIEKNLANAEERLRLIEASDAATDARKLIRSAQNELKAAEEAGDATALKKAQQNLAKAEKALQKTELKEARRQIKAGIKEYDATISDLREQISRAKINKDPDQAKLLTEQLDVLKADQADLAKALREGKPTWGERVAASNPFKAKVTATAADAEEVVSKPNLWERITAGYRSATEAKVTRVKTNQAIESVSKWQDRLKDAKKAKASVEEIAKIEKNLANAEERLRLIEASDAATDARKLIRSAQNELKAAEEAGDATALKKAQQNLAKAEKALQKTELKEARRQIKAGIKEYDATISDLREQISRAKINKDPDQAKLLTEQLDVLKADQADLAKALREGKPTWGERVAGLRKPATINEISNDTGDVIITTDNIEDAGRGLGNVVKFNFKRSDIDWARTAAAIFGLDLAKNIRLALVSEDQQMQSSQYLLPEGNKAFNQYSYVNGTIVANPASKNMAVSDASKNSTKASGERVRVIRDSESGEVIVAKYNSAFTVKGDDVFTIKTDSNCGLLLSTKDSANKNSYFEVCQVVATIDSDSLQTAQNAPTIRVYVRDNGVPVANTAIQVEVTSSVANGVVFNKNGLVTDSNGYIEIPIFGLVEGDYTFKIKANGKYINGTALVTFASTEDLNQQKSTSDKTNAGVVERIFKFWADSFRQRLLKQFPA